jgi:indole-3-glycerol phosphate synthase
MPETIEKQTFLSRIMEKKRERVGELLTAQPLEDLRRAAFAKRAEAEPHRFLNALEKSASTNIIAEFKRRSPSKGAISQNANPAEIALKYQSGGAAAISVLTEADFFGGSFADLQAVVESTGDRIPVLCKDFVFDEAQIYQAAIAGASAILLIVAVFDDNETIEKLRRTAEADLKMDALIEVHTAEEMRRAAEIGARIIGVNNRDLLSFKVSLETSIELQKLAPQDAILVSESGLSNREEIKRLQNTGFNAFLIGETLMRADDTERALRELIYEN